MELVKFFLLVVMLAAVCDSAIIDSKLQKRLLFPGGGSGNSTQNVMISFSQGIQSVFDKINSMNFSSNAGKRFALTNAQQAFANAVQAPLQGFLKTMGVKFQSFWINNKIVVPNVNSRLVQLISKIPGVLKIEEEPIVRINLPFNEQNVVIMETSSNLTRPVRQSELPWGITKIRVDHVWSSWRGRGVVVANIDTGVHGTHEALRSNWRSSYGWYDPYANTATPNDQNGHGTHTMGTIAGTNGIGVAPEATWIACKGCNTDTCGASQLYACGQWIQCPTDINGKNAKCDMAPHVVSNSWGSSGGQYWYNDIIRSWRVANIIPVFAIGNSGPSCTTAGSPGDRHNVISVGSTESNDRISTFSSRGPSTDGVIKPDISAPGGEVRSAWHTSDNAYNTISGTSMACPHVSGVVALMLEKKPSLEYQRVLRAMTITAKREELDITGARTCGERSVYNGTWPNNVFGWGRIDAVHSLYAAGMHFYSYT